MLTNAPILFVLRIHMLCCYCGCCGSWEVKIKWALTTDQRLIWGFLHSDFEIRVIVYFRKMTVFSSQKLVMEKFWAKTTAISAWLSVSGAEFVQLTLFFIAFLNFFQQTKLSIRVLNHPVDLMLSWIARNPRLKVTKSSVESSCVWVFTISMITYIKIWSSFRRLIQRVWLSIYNIIRFLV